MRRFSVLIALLSVSAATFASPAAPTDTYRLSVVHDHVIVTQKDLSVPAQGSADFVDTRKVPYLMQRSETEDQAGHRVVQDTIGEVGEGLTAQVTRLVATPDGEVIRFTMEYAQIESINRVSESDAPQMQTDLVNRNVASLLQTVKLNPGESISFRAAQGEGQNNLAVTLTRVAKPEQVAAL